MAIQLSGEVGRTGRPEDVAVVQALLANIRGRDGRPFWPGAIDGRAGDALAAAVERCQRFADAGLLNLGSPERPGSVRPGSQTLAAMKSLAPRGFDGLRAATVTSPIVLYAQDDPAARAASGRADPGRVPSGTHRNLAVIRVAQGALLRRRALGTSVRDGGLAGDRWGFTLTLDGLTVVQDDGSWRIADERADSIPSAVWALVDAEFQGYFDTGGQGRFSSRTALASLAGGGVDEALFTRMDVPRPGRLDTVRAASAALRLIGEADGLPADRREELEQLIAVVGADEPATGRLLEERWRTMRNGLGPSSFRYASYQQLRDHIRRRGYFRDALLRAGLLAKGQEALAELRGGSKPGLALVLADLLVDGAEADAARRYAERRRAAALRGGTVAGHSVAPGTDRMDYLFDLFDVRETELARTQPARFGDAAGDRDGWIGRLLDVMERVLAARVDGAALAAEIETDWLLDDRGVPGSDYLYVRLRRVLRQAIEGTNPTNAHLRPDIELAAHARWLATVKSFKDVGGFADLLASSRSAQAATTHEFWAGWLGWLIGEHAEAVALAEQEIERRESGL